MRLFDTSWKKVLGGEKLDQKKSKKNTHQEQRWQNQ